MSTFELLTTAQAAAELGLSEIRVRQICAEGKLGQRIGRQWLISSEELRQFKKVPRPVGNPNFKRKIS